MDLRGTVLVVTGGNGGLGQRICHALVAQGCHIAVVYAQSKEQAAGVARDPERHQVSAATFACDVTGLGPQGSSIAYAVSKAGLIHLTKCMAVALAPEVLVNCVAPGLLEGTRATSNLRPEQIENSAKTSLLRKAADKDDVADQVVTMCRTNTMTGQTIVIDSGRTFH